MTGRPLTNREVGDLARALGHERIAIGETASGRRWFVECSCGYGEHLADGKPTVTRATLDEAVRTGQHHLRKAVADWQQTAARNGRVAAMRRA